MSDEKLTLHDIAALIVQIEPTDVADLSRVRKALNIIAETSPIFVQRTIIEAVNKIDQMIGEKGSDTSDLLAGIGALIEEAIDAMEKSDEGKISFSDSKDEQVSIENDPALLEEFITDSQELVASAEAALLELERDPENTEAVNTVFRAFHTIKGTSAFLGLDHILKLTHGGESFLSRIRDKEIHCIDRYADLAFRSVDMLKDLIEVVQNSSIGNPIVAPDGLDDLIALLNKPEAASIVTEADEEAVKMPLRLGDILVAQGKADREKIEAIAADRGDQPIGLAIVRSGIASLTEVGRALRKQRFKGSTKPTGESSIRVRTDRLDRLIEIVGELVISHSMVAQDKTVNSGIYPELQWKVNHTDKIVRQMQALCMSIRMVPLRATFHKIARLVRDLAHRRKININFIPVGEDTEIDRTMVDLINDPLIHLVRNAVDHGIELPEERESNGKPSTGTLLLKAYHSGGNVVVEISDDGKGLDRDKIIQKAIEKGIIESGKGMSDSEVHSLIFQPGFSTADKVTDLSGRGVGLDVVKEAIETLRGRVDISSEYGKGCTFSIRLPLTMAITDGMLVKVGNHQYILPTINIDMSFRPDAKALSTVAGRGEIVIFKGK
ncbi:MAG: hypothetical protein A2169_10930, partial [Deltaproteobacteria bacterium RBG_13_47_9]